jgi:hypothetical protein
MSSPPVWEDAEDRGLGSGEFLDSRTFIRRSALGLACSKRLAEMRSGLMFASLAVPLRTSPASLLQKTLIPILTLRAHQVLSPSFSEIDLIQDELLPHATWVYVHTFARPRRTA